MVYGTDGQGDAGCIDVSYWDFPGSRPIPKKGGVRGPVPGRGAGQAPRSRSDHSLPPKKLIPTPSPARILPLSPAQTGSRTSWVRRAGRRLAGKSGTHQLER